MATDIAGEKPLEFNIESEVTDVDLPGQELFDLIEVEGAVDADEPRVFRTSEMQQPPELTSYLEEVICDPFNHYCLNCKQNQSTHFLVVMGAFICETCSKAFLSSCGGNKNCHVKNVFGE